jgi:hypothetical protein
MSLLVWPGLVCKPVESRAASWVGRIVRILFQKPMPGDAHKQKPVLQSQTEFQQ